jgi:serine/threonine-protein kinase
MEQSKTGTAEKGSTIRIIISIGKADIEVPDVMGWGVSDAKGYLQGQGWSVSTTEQTSDSPSGTVINQSPSGTISGGSDKSISLTVSSGPAQSPSEPDTTTDDSSAEGDKTSADTGA